MLFISYQFKEQNFCGEITLWRHKKGDLQYFPTNRAYLSPKIGERKKLSKSVSGYFTTKKKKNPTAIEPEGGGGKALMARPLRKNFFCGFPIKPPPE